MEDLFTIALPVYKRTEFIKSALDCAVNQTVKCRILLIDNNSPHDEFNKIIQSYNNPLIKYIKTDRTVPQDENFNNCFRFSETPWLTILHDDDMLHFQFVELARFILNSYKDQVGGFVVGNHVSQKEWDTGYQKLDFTNDIKLVKEPYFYFAQLSPFPGVVLHRETALKLGGFNADKHPIADFDFWYRYSTTVPMLYVNQYFAFYRISPQQSTNNLIDNMINKVYQYRTNLIAKGKYNNYMSRLALEYTRINNINFFKDTYPDLDITTEFINEVSLRKAERLLKSRIISKLIRLYIQYVSFSRINPISKN